ncbi:cyanate permease [Sphingobium sp. OAS761]|uniref:MFS transporter n=1 Tax=Sphingobium sp. OAS761 TaxID=2817901 RepID=UPI00209D8F27|nr:MFS transporter [Sphingobium sp. OAS761]MCP1470392.1 cyanate permease [Sphingobium sp. OAS761]
MEAMTRAAEPAGSPMQRRLMVGRAFLAQNVAVGCAFGGFGVSVLPLQQKFGASSATAALALSICVLVLGLASPAIGALIGRIGLRWTMMAGVIISAIGYALLAVAPSMTVVLLAYALPIGIGLAMFGPFPSSVLASNWYAHNPGTALGVANTPLFAALLPMIGMAVIRDHGLSAFYWMMVGLHILLLPFILGVSDGPADRAHAPDAHGHVAHEMITARSLLRNPTFWAVCLGAGFLNAVGITGVSHLAGFVAERGVAAADAAALLSVMGGSAVIGSLVIGILCGRLGAPRALSILAAGLALSWFAMLGTTAFAVMALCALVIGAAGAGVFPAVNMLSAHLFGQHSLPRVIGLFAIVTLPLTFGIPPLVGLLRDAVGRYGPVIGLVIGGCAVAAFMFFAMSRIGRRAPPAELPAA